MPPEVPAAEEDGLPLPLHSPASRASLPAREKQGRASGKGRGRGWAGRGARPLPTLRASRCDAMVLAGLRRLAEPR
jgi:hypothetical protein